MCWIVRLHKRKTCETINIIGTPSMVVVGYVMTLHGRVDSILIELGMSMRSWRGSTGTGASPRKRLLWSTPTNMRLMNKEDIHAQLKKLNNYARVIHVLTFQDFFGWHITVDWILIYENKIYPCLTWWYLLYTEFVLKMRL